MPKPILVGFDPRTADRAPVDFGLAAARFTGAPLVVGCVSAGKISERPAGQVEEDLAEEAVAALDVGPSHVVQVVEASSGWPLAEGAVWSSPVIELEPAG